MKLDQMTRNDPLEAWDDSVVPKLCNSRLRGHQQAATHLGPWCRHRGKSWGILQWLYLWNRLTDFDDLTFDWKLLMFTFSLA